MSKKIIITIGRESGSGGKHVGELISQKLNIPFYDKELLAVAAKNSGLCEEIFEFHDEKPTGSFLYSLVSDTYSFGYRHGGAMDMPLNQKVFLAQFEAIQKIADEGSCVIVGRCADYALADYPEMTSVFLHGNLEDKIKYTMEYYNLPENKAKEYIVKTDKKRSSYYNYYSDKRWGSLKSYDLCLNSSILGHEGTADFIIEFVKRRFHLDSI